MCGLVGIVGANLNHLHTEAFKWMLHLDVTRGEDSTGIAFRRIFTTKNNRSQIIVAKAEGHPSNLIRKFPELFDSKGILHSKVNERFDFLMGHNRAATVGAINSTNAHPFHQGTITGCHNGTISSGLYNLPTGDEITGHTDSEKLIFALSKGWSIKQIMDVVVGAAAMTWWDSTKKTFNLYRNKERTLFYTHNDAKTIYAYASEEWILKLSLGKAKLHEYTKNIKEFPVDQHMEIVIGDNKIEEIKTSNVAPLVIKTPVTPVNRHNVKLLNHNKPIWLDKREVNKENKPFQSEAGWLDLKDLTEEEFNENAKYGCSLCQADLEYNDYLEGFVKWFQRDTPICISCCKEFKTA